MLKGGYKLAEKLQCLLEHSSICKRASGLRGEGSFYVNIGKHLSKQKKMHVCKDCIQEYIGDMKNEKDKAIENALTLFPFLDIAYIHELFMQQDDIGVYFRLLGLNYSDRGSWKDSTFPDDAQIDELIEIDDDMRDAWSDRWGDGLSTSEYLFLEKRFSRLCNEFELDDYSKEIIFIQICYTQLNLRKANKVGAPTDKLVKQLQDLMGSADLKPSQRSLTAQNSATLGVSIKELEDNEPIIIDEEFKDINRIESYFKRHFIDHFAKMLELKK